MGILSVMNRNLLSKLKPIYSSNPCHIRRLLSAAATGPTLAGDLKPESKPMFLIERFDQKSRNYTLLSAASCKDILNPFSEIFSDEHLLRGSCNEFTVFFDNVMKKEGDISQRRVSLWNPTTKRIHTLPAFVPRPYSVTCIDIECSGFGFEPKSQDYKLICFLQYQYEHLFSSQGEDHIEVYSLKTDSWKPITATPLYTTPLHEPAVCVNGIYHWVAER